MTNRSDQNAAPAKVGLVLHSPARYDFVVWLLTLGREQAFREKILRLARLEPGESVLDVGCGTGTLAIAAKRHVGPTGMVQGVDPSPEMLARANKKAKKADLEIVFKNGAAQVLPFPDAQFNAVFTTMMLHHLPRNGREQCAREIARVLKPGGRALAVDFGSPERERQGFFGHLHRHGFVHLPNLMALFSEAGLNIVDSGKVGMRDLRYVLAKAPSLS